MQSAYDAVKNGSMSICLAADIFGVPVETLRMRVKDLVPLDAKNGRPSLIESDLEKKLIAWVDQMVDPGFPVSRDDIDVKAKLLCPGLKCSNRWFTGTILLLKLKTNLM
eukprot:Pompholyxophrys_sp_v1_NODE_72_length_2434_cov_5.681379.p3 type:complete len:109 gc:universal NODE_72_length_2434_cov_5.681379:610-936(+)